MYVEGRIVFKKRVIQVLHHKLCYIYIYFEKYFCSGIKGLAVFSFKSYCIWQTDS